VGDRGAPGGGGPGAPGGGGSDQRQSFADEIADRFAQRIQNPFDAALKIKDALILTDDQVTQLQGSSQTFRLRLDSLTGDIRAQLKKLGVNVDMGSMAGIMRKTFPVVRDMTRAAIDELQHELTPEQWLNVPDSIKGTGRPMGGGGRGGGRPPPP
jgi:hypothetical protein